MGFTFAVDSEKIDELSSSLTDKNKKVREKIELIYSMINELNGSWSGTVYDEFKAKCEQYKPSLNELCEIIDEFVNELKDISGEVDDLEEEIKSACSIG